jgi:minor extracellular serine protease Vpr
MNSRFPRHLWVTLLFLSASWGQIVPDRYIVELSSAPAAGRLRAQGRRANSPEVERRGAEVRSEQARTKFAIEQEGGRVLESADTVINAIFVQMPAGDATRLALIPGVRHVHPVRQFKPLLDRAVVVHKIVDAWNQIGLDHAGLGIKIAMIDTGIDNTHPAFQDSSLPVPSGFPKTNNVSDQTYTNHKVIVARSYVSLLATTDPDQSARDRQGHGTGTAMTAAGVLNAGPLATIRGVAPKAYLGSYKVFGSPGVNDTATEDAILKAIDDAAKDGMDVINLSLGDPVALPLADDLEDVAIANVASLGAIVVVAGGNSGPDLHTIGSPASALGAISVGASLNDRRFAATATTGGARYIATPGSEPAPAKALTARLKDITTLGDNGLACAPFAAGSLKGDIALILRGTCFFSDKIAHVVAGGAVGALVYTDQARPDAITMDVGTQTLPAMMVSYADGISIKNHLAAHSSETATLDFNLQPFSVDPDKLADFTAKGPNVDGSIKPDMVAVGMYVYTAAQKFDSKGDMYDASGYSLVDGTSFSSPIVAGGAALLKEARPGLTVAQYRSLLVNTAAPAFLQPGVPARVQEAGAGMLDMSAALRASGAAVPTSLAFGVGGVDVQASQKLSISNVSAASETFTIFVTGRDAPTGPVPPGSRTAEALATSGKEPVVTVSTHSLTLGAGASADITVGMTAFGLPAGAYEGFIHVLGTNSGVDERVPYWYGVGSPVPAHITVLQTVDSPKAGTFNQDAVLFRVTDANGITVAGANPTATVLDGGGNVGGISNHDAFMPGVFGLNVTLGPAKGANDFEIRVSTLKQTVTIVAQ